MPNRNRRLEFARCCYGQIHLEEIEIGTLGTLNETSETVVNDDMHVNEETTVLQTIGHNGDGHDDIVDGDDEAESLGAACNIPEERAITRLKSGKLEALTYTV